MVLSKRSEMGGGSGGFGHGRRGKEGKITKEER